MSDPFLGEIRIVGFGFAPRGWARCDGQLLSISQYSALFSLLGTTFGGDGETTFGLPGLRGRVPVHVGSGPGLAPIAWGQKGGQNDVTLTTNQIPSHTHTPRCVTPAGNSNDANNNFWADDIGTASGTYHSGPATNNMNSGAIQNTGGGQAHNNMQPFLGLYFVIALTGIFPSRS